MKRTATPFVLLLALGSFAVLEATACPGSKQACAAPTTRTTAVDASAASAASPSACAAPTAQAAAGGSSCCAMSKSAERVTAKHAKTAKKAKMAKKAPAARTTAKAAPVAAPAGASTAPAAGMRAFLDPETGVIGGMPSDLAGDALAGTGARATGVPIETVLPDGSIMVDLQGTLEDYLVLTVGPDGKRSMQCVKDPSHVHAAPAPASAPQPEVR